MVESEGSSQHCPITDEGVHPFVSSFRRRVVSIVLRRPIPKCLCWGFKTYLRRSVCIRSANPAPNPKHRKATNNRSVVTCAKCKPSGGQNRLWSLGETWRTQRLRRSSRPAPRRPLPIVLAESSLDPSGRCRRPKRNIRQARADNGEYDRRSSEEMRCDRENANAACSQGRKAYARDSADHRNQPASSSHAVYLRDRLQPTRPPTIRPSVNVAVIASTGWRFTRCIVSSIRSSARSPLRLTASLMAPTPSSIASAIADVARES